MKQSTGDQGQEETHAAVQRGRARQYTLCTIALQYDRLSVGAEGVFDQALTNGLAAIVAYTWPGKEVKRSGSILSATELLTTIENHGALAEDGEDCVKRVPHDPDGTIYDAPPGEKKATEDQNEPADDETGEWWLKPIWDDSTLARRHRLANFTTVNLTTLRAAVKATQAIRHARDADVDDEERQVLTEEHLHALMELDFHPALGGVGDAMQDRWYATTETADKAERARAARFYSLLCPDELERREQVDYRELHESHYKDEDVEVEECPVCGNLSLVADCKERTLCEIGVGTCVVCSYERSYAVAEDMAESLQLRRAIDRDD
ncbi:hypothetical protein GWI34_25500 [Actinomadura sp. DSM 109109]|nr:hypothetical protein [Actinomadura lepetitiana]